MSDELKNSEEKQNESFPNKQSKQKLKLIIIGLAILFMISLGGVFIINEAYKAGNGYITLWGPADILAFYGSYLSFIGSVVLGVVAVYQNKKAQVLNEQLQKLQQAQFISMVSATKMIINRRSRTLPDYLNTKMPDISVVDLTLDGFPTAECYHVDVEFENDSNYPIVQLIVHPGERSSVACQLYGMQTLIEKATYIKSRSKQCYRFIIPCEVFDNFKNYEIGLNLGFVNVFDYCTPAILHIKDLSNQFYKNEYQYRLSKFVDIRPK